MTERVSLSANVDIAEERERADNAILLHSIVRHFHVPCANCLDLDTTEVYCLLFQVVLDDFDDGGTVNSKKMDVSSIPNCTTNRRVVVGSHSHTRLPRTLASEDVDSRGLSDIGGTLENFYVALVVGSTLAIMFP